MKKMSLRTQLYIMLMGLSLLMVLSIGCVVCAISYRNVMNLSVQTCNQLVDKTQDELNVLLEGMSDMPEVIGRDSRVQKAMRSEFEGESSSEIFDIQYEISAFLSEMNHYDTNIFCIYFFSENGVSAQSKFYRLTVEDLKNSQIYRNACQIGKTIWCPPQNGSAVSITAGERVISTVTPIKEIGSGKYDGAVIIELEEKCIMDCLNAGIGKSGFLYICDENGKPIIYPEGKDAKTLEAWSQHNEAQRLSEGLMIRRELENCGWSVIGIVPRSDLTDNIRSIVFMTVLVCLTLLALSLFIIVRVTDRILRPIDALNQKMGQVADGNLSVRVEITRHDEIGTLMSRFNEMVKQIDGLVKREAENQKELRLTELKALQAQIKPHFLYNTLDSIIWMARGHDQEGVIQMVMSLTNFLKIGLSKGEEIIPLEQEIQHTASYLEIQGVRYRGKFVYTISVEDSVKACLTPKLIVQPLVENAIYHGMKLKRDLCHLEIWAGERNDRVVIDVADDGVGMDPATAKALQISLQNGMCGGQANGYGVVNVNERIQIMYGHSFGITFETVLGEGCTFHITLPKFEEDDQQ